MTKNNLLISLKDEVSKGFIGNEILVEDALTAMVSGLHILIEDVSGVGKTTLCKSISKASGLNNSRIQFTPDLLPGDITGMTIWDSQTREFVLKKGPIFNEFILADEINRASARTQSALLEAMEEKTVTIDGEIFPLPNYFTVFATKNPSNYLGTFELPESQMDRFGIVLKPGYPSSESEIQILSEIISTDTIDNVKKISCGEDLVKLRDKVLETFIDRSVVEYTVNIGNKTRSSKDIKVGLSTRSLKHIISFAKGRATLSNRYYVIPEDIIYSVYRVAPHKIELSQDSILNSISPLTVLKSIIDSVRIPVGIK